MTKPRKVFFSLCVLIDHCELQQRQDPRVRTVTEGDPKGTLRVSRGSVLVLVLLSWDEPADAVGPQDGVRAEACDEEDGEDQQPVDAPHGDTGQGPRPVRVRYVHGGADVKPWRNSDDPEDTEDATATARRTKRPVPVWLAMKDVRVSSVRSVWLKRAIGLAPWNRRMLGTATVPNLVERLETTGACWALNVSASPPSVSTDP